jgi:hypothetical protein
VIAAIVEAHEDLKASGYMKLENKSHELKDDDKGTDKQPAKEQRNQDKRSQDTKHWPRGPSKDYEEIDKLPFKGSPDPKHRQQSKIHDAMKNGLCLNCFEKGHVSRNCKKPMTAATKHFHASKMKFWNCCSGSSGLENHATTVLNSFGNYSFQGGTTVQVTANVYVPKLGYDLPSNSDGTFPTSISPTDLALTTIGVDTHSDATVVLRKLAFHIRPVDETMNTGGGESACEEEGPVIVEGEPGVFATIPALIADSPRTQLPCGCDVLLGNGEILPRPACGRDDEHRRR